jgi:hypothetical protein
MEVKITILRNLLEMNENSHWMFKNVCIISRHGSLWQSSNEFLATRRSLDHRNTKYRFCYSKKHAKYGGQMRTPKTTLHKCCASHRIKNIVFIDLFSDHWTIWLVTNKTVGHIVKFLIQNKYSSSNETRLLIRTSGEWRTVDFCQIIVNSWKHEYDA